MNFKKNTTYTITSGKHTVQATYVKSGAYPYKSKDTGLGDEIIHTFSVTFTKKTSVMNIHDSDIASGFYTIIEVKSDE